MARGEWQAGRSIGGVPESYSGSGGPIWGQVAIGPNANDAYDSATVGKSRTALVVPLADL